PADRTRAGLAADDLGVHRAGPFGGLALRYGVSGRTRQEPLRIGAELFEAALGAEEIGVPLVLEVADRIRRRNRHPAHRVHNFRGRRFVLWGHYVLIPTALFLRPAL